MNEELKDAWVRRLDAVAERLRRHAEAGRPDGLTGENPETGERWEAGQVWAHIAEFVPYWTAQLASLFERWGGEPLPFGRTSTDSARIEAIERDRATSPAALFERTAAAVDRFRTWLPTWGEREFDAKAMHARLGVLDVPAAVERFVVGHLEEHADQLDALRGTS